MIDKAFSPKRKERVKVIKTIIEFSIIIVLILFAINVLFETKSYTPVPEAERTSDKGFIALSYFGVERQEEGSLIDDDRLNEELAALKASGYQTITQEDIYNYYKYGKKLPSKSLCLLFEDGRKDSVLFAQKILENLNYKATVFTYADKFKTKDSKFLSIKELLELKEGTFWEAGTNGYRLAYINTFDRYNKFLGVLNSNEFAMLSPYIDNNYNHYLMDFIKDRDSIPIENKEEMTKRISYDYKKLAEIYEAGLGSVPNMYVLMHSNTPYYASNPLVGQVNEKLIKEIFEMSFNREGESLNTSQNSIYDLTRLQPQAYWYTNHLLMRLWDDTKNNMAFVSGDTKRKANWDNTMGASEFRKNVIVLTSLPKNKGLMRLKDSGDLKNFNLSVTLDGNKVGCQGIYLRSDSALNTFVKVEIKNDVLYISEKSAGAVSKQLFSCDLSTWDGTIPQSIEENKLETEMAENKTLINYSNDKSTIQQAKTKLNAQSKTTVATVKDGAKAYTSQLSISEKGSRALNITLSGSSLTVLVDGKVAVQKLGLKVNQAGYLCLDSAFGGYGYSQRNITDDVYDGVFTDLQVSEVNADDGVIYSNKLTVRESIYAVISNSVNAVINWFIETF